jgi:hypothetical protein
MPVTVPEQRQAHVGIREIQRIQNLLDAGLLLGSGLFLESPVHANRFPLHDAIMAEIP